MNYYAQNSLSVEQSYNRLVKGNQRFCASTGRSGEDRNKLKTLALRGQRPHAVLVCCSDSRIMPSLIFDIGPGELFCIRSFGNIIGEMEMASIEYAVTSLRTRLIVVMGHTKCGAIQSAVEAGDSHQAIKPIVDEIRPFVTEVKRRTFYNIYHQVENAHIERQVSKLRKNEVLHALEKDRQLFITGAKYNIETAEVAFWDRPKEEE